ncbi:MAG: 3'-5' exoribonuclease YhaM family protein [Chloroflexota bacterium]
MSMQVADFNVGRKIEGFYAVVDARPAQRRDGTPFLRARLRDATGTVDAVAWDNVEASREVLASGRVVKVRGLVGKAYHGEGLELTIEKVRCARDDEYAPTDFLRRSRRDPGPLVDELRRLVDSLGPPVGEVVRAALDPELDRFSEWPAAEALHHAWLGGLLEHSLEVAQLCDAIVRAIPGPDRDLVIAGALLHDVGKLDTYEVGTTFGATDEGRLYGHILTGFHRVKVACDTVRAPTDLARHLLHIVASHHGTLEHGAAREPYTREAIVVHYADELSAQLMQAGEAIAARHDPTARWTERAMGLKRDIFVGHTYQDH